VSALSNRQGEYDNIRLFPCSIEDDFATVQRHIEIADRKIATAIGQLPLVTGLEIDEPDRIDGVGIHELS